MNKMKAVFLGTPDIAVPFLEAVKDSPYVELIAVLSQPDRPVGRGLKLTPSPVSLKATALGIPLFKPAKKKEIHAVIENLKPDIAITCAYGRIILEETINLAKQGFLNIHFSLLPKYRGAAPVQRALMAGEKESGITIFWLDKNMDTGPILVSESLNIEISDDAKSLFSKMTAAGVNLINEALNLCAQNKAPHIPQTGEISYANMLSPQDAVFNFSGKAIDIHNHIRGLSCGPYARFEMEISGKKQMIQVFNSMPSTDNFGKFSTGEIAKIEKNGGFHIQCGEGTLYIKEVKPEGKKIMKGSDFLNGLRLKAGNKI